MGELSIFIDESGDFGEYDHLAPYYIIGMVFYDQKNDISGPLQKLKENLTNIGYPETAVHTGPIIHRENEYEFEEIKTRRKIFNHMITFIKHVDIQYKCFHIEKKHIDEYSGVRSINCPEFGNHHSGDEGITHLQRNMILDVAPLVKAQGLDKGRPIQ